MTYRTASHKLRTVRTNSKPDDSPDSSFHRGGWLDWSRIPLVVTPQKEWQHMFDEAWRLQKEMFWMPHMGDVDWDAMYRRYQPCVQRLTCLSELHSLISDLQGELGTSHAYIMPPKPVSQMADVLGTIGCSWSYCPTNKAYRITHLYEGDDRHPVPLQRPGINVKKGDLIYTMAGQTLSPHVSPDHIVSHYVGQAMTMTVGDDRGEKSPRTVMVFPVSKSREGQWAYRQWVNHCRRFVHEQTQGRVGYIHIPDMQEKGMREFLMGYTQEFDKDGLIVDVRYNGGGNLSYLMLDYLRRQRLGYDQSRHQGMLPYPAHSPKGPMVAVANEYTGSDGDIFSHAFKTLKLGPLVGKRTWGGVVGIWTRYDLMDGTVTSQPEYSFWFQEVGWSIENQGVPPTIDIDITPMDSAHNKDPQLLCAIEQVEQLIKQDQPRQSLLYPKPGSEPTLASRWTSDM
jgi:tricorn protease